MQDFAALQKKERRRLLKRHEHRPTTEFIETSVRVFQMRTFAIKNSQI